MFGFLFLAPTFSEMLMPGMGKITFGGVTGFAMGLALRKILKLLLLVLGILFILFQFLAYQEILVVNWIKIQSLIHHVLTSEGTNAQNLITILTAHLPTTGGFMAGFILGFKKG